MGGKKKTKWRKVPLEEFTKDIPTKTEKTPQENECPRDITLDESNYNTVCNETADAAQYYTEPYEYIDGFYYPTSCVLYNPVDASMFPNYIVPVDNNCYYYYTVPPEMSQVQEYAPVPYQEYTPPIPKDTVYLLLPTQSLGTPQSVPYGGPEWQNRRRRRRYEGHAEYAVIPDKTNSTNIKETDTKKESNYASYRRGSQPSSNKRMSSQSDTNNFQNNISVIEKQQIQNKSKDPKDNSALYSNSSKEKISKPISKIMDIRENNQKHKKSSDVCGIHIKQTVDTQMIDDTPGKISPSLSTHDSNILQSENSSTEKLNADEASKNIDSRSEKENYQVTESKDTLNIQYSKQIKNIPNTPLQVMNKSHDSVTSAQDCNSKKDNYESTENSTNFSKKADMVSLKKSDLKDNPTSTLPDILSTLNKPSVSSKASGNENVTNTNAPNKQMTPNAKSFLSQTSYLPNLMSSEALHNEMESELNHLHNLHSLRANQSIYKLAFDESITDHSEADSRSPSPIDPESQIPSSLPNDEILIHEADSGSEAGSEDVELIPHRYESETFLNENKHMYVNRLSLAVELLRTQETLPYDEEFKRVVPENPKIVPVHSRSNKRLTDDPNIPKQTVSKSNEGSAFITLCQTKHSAHSSNDSAIFSDIEFDNLDIDESCETAKEVDVKTGDNQEMSEGIRVGYRRLGAHARFFSPRATLSLNPCFCCSIM